MPSAPVATCVGDFSACTADSACPANSAALRPLLNAFIEADEVPAITEAWSALVTAAGLDGVGCAPGQEHFFERVRSRLKPAANFRQKRLWRGLAARLERSKAIALPPGNQTRLVVVGGGPCGLRAAVEAAVLGFTVHVIEGRSTFSRHNVLKTWECTVHDLMELGHGVYHPSFQAHGSHFTGTRELQTTLLKAALLLGVTFVHGQYVGGVARPSMHVPSHAVWTEGARPAPATAEGPANVLALCPNASVAYAEKANKVNFIERARSAEGAISPAVPVHALAAYPFDVLVDGSGEKSVLTRHLGFEKSLQRYGPAIGLVVNLQLDPTVPQHALPPEIILGFSAVAASAAPLKALAARGLVCECLEYMRAGTHFIAATVQRHSAVHLGIFREDRATIADCLARDNVDEGALRSTARALACAVGLPAAIPFAAVNAVQIFDFSVKGQLTQPHRSAPFAFFPVGDALSSPYWPQGLGVNRGFHTALDAVWAAREVALGRDPAPERSMAFMLQNFTVWSARLLTPQPCWTADPVARYSPALFARVARDSDSRHYALVTERARAALLDRTLRPNTPPQAHGGAHTPGC